MVWMVLALIIAVVHVVAIVMGRRTTDPLQRAAFFSGVLGLLSFPLLFLVGLKNLCIAGGCRGAQDVGLYLVVGLFLALAAVSGGSAAALAVRRSHA